jgi:hypothetical protein
MLTLNLSQCLASTWTSYTSPYTAIDRGHFHDVHEVKTDDGDPAEVATYTSWGKVETEHTILASSKEILTIEARVEAKYGGWFAWGKVQLEVWYEYEGGKTVWESAYSSKLKTSYQDRIVSVDLNGAQHTPDTDFRYFIQVAKSIHGSVYVDHIEIRIEYE